MLPDSSLQVYVLALARGRSPTPRLEVTYENGIRPARTAKGPPKMSDASTGTRQLLSVTKSRSWHLWGAMLLALLLLCLRTPYAALHGAIVGEEGTVYLRFAWDTPLSTPSLPRIKAITRCSR